MPRTFISYRRSDSSEITGRIGDHLVRRFGSKSIFWDVSSIEPGANFKAAINQSLAACEIMLVIIGSEWLSVADDQGTPRLSDELDFVRIEVETALRLPHVRVIPVLVNGAAMPTADDLPPTLKELAQQQAISVRSDPSFDTDIKSLIAKLEHLSANPHLFGYELRRQTLAISLLLLLVILFGAFIAVQLLRDRADTLSEVDIVATSLAQAFDATATADSAARQTSSVYPPQSFGPAISGFELVDEAGAKIGNGEVRVYSPRYVRRGEIADIRVEIQVDAAPLVYASTDLAALESLAGEEPITLVPLPSPTPVLGTPHPTPSPLPMADKQFVEVREYMGARLGGIDASSFEIHAVPPSGLRRMYEGAINWWKWTIRPSESAELGLKHLEVYIYLPLRRNDNTVFEQETNIIPINIMIQSEDYSPGALTVIPLKTDFVLWPIQETLVISLFKSSRFSPTEIRLTAGNGTALTSDSPNVTVVDYGYIEQWIITDPIPGHWDVEGPSENLREIFVSTTFRQYTDSVILNSLPENPDSVSIVGYFVDSASRSVTDWDYPVEVMATVTHETGASITLRLDETAKGRFEGQFTSLGPGSYSVVINAISPGFDDVPTLIAEHEAITPTHNNASRVPEYIVLQITSPAEEAETQSQPVLIADSLRVRFETRLERSGTLVDIVPASTDPMTIFSINLVDESDNHLPLDDLSIVQIAPGQYVANLGSFDSGEYVVTIEINEQLETDYALSPIFSRDMVAFRAELSRTDMLSLPVIVLYVLIFALILLVVTISATAYRRRQTNNNRLG